MRAFWFVQTYTGHLIKDERVVLFESEAAAMKAAAELEHDPDGCTAWIVAAVHLDGSPEAHDGA